MAVDIMEQGQALLEALLLGLAAGVFYDLLRILRVRIKIPFFAHGLDFLFWILVTFGVFLWSQEAWGGTVRLYGILFLLLGGLTYFLLISRLILYLGYRIADIVSFLCLIIRLPVTLVLHLVKKISKILKNYFQFQKKWYNIDRITGEMDATIRRHGGQVQGGVDGAIQTGQRYHKSHHSRTTHLHGHIPPQSAWSDSGDTTAECDDTSENCRYPAGKSENV